MTQPFPFGAVNRAIASEVGEGPTADALRALAQAAGGGGSGPGGVGYDAIFRPGTPSSGNAFATEAEVFAAIATIDFPRVGIDLTATPNPGVAFVVTQDWDLRGGSIFAIYPVTDTFKLQFNEPHQLLNTQSVQIGLGVHFNRSATPGIAYPLFPTSIPHILAVVGGAVVWSEGTFPVIDLIGETQAISLLTGAVRLTGGAAPFVRGDTTSAVIAVNLASSGSLGQSLDNDWIAGPVGMQLGYIADASFAAPTLAAFFGTFNGTTLIDRSVSVTYDDTLVAPPFIAAPPNAFNVQLALDTIKGLLPAWRNVLDTATLSALPTAGVAWGQIVHVETLDAFYYYVTPASPTLPSPSGLSVLPDSGAGGVWVRIPNATPTWTQQSAWFVDAALGSDESTGNGPGAAALATLGELFNRLAPYGEVIPPFGTIYTVTIDYAAGAIYYLNAAMLSGAFDGSASRIEFLGTPNVISASTFAASTAPAPGTNTKALATSANGAEVFVPGELVHLPDSGSPDTYAAVSSGPAANQCRLTRPYNIFAPIGILAYPAPGDRYERLQLPTVQIDGTVNQVAQAASRMSLLFLSCAPGNPTTPGVTGIRLYACSFDGAALDGVEGFVCSTYDSGSVPTTTGKKTTLSFSRIGQMDAYAETVVETAFLANDASPYVIRVFGTGLVTMVGSSQVQVPLGQPFTLMQTGAQADITPAFCLLGTSFYVVSFGDGIGAQNACDVTLYTNGANSTCPGYVGASARDFNYPSYALDAWFPPLPAGGGAVLPSAPVPTFAVLNPAPFSGVATHVRTGARFLPAF